MSAPSAPGYVDPVISLRDQYSHGVSYGDKACTIHIVKSFSNRGFMGSANVVFLSSEDVMQHETPACIAAPLVTMVAKRAILLGTAGQEDQPVSVRLYVPLQLSITTTHLSVGDVSMLVEPQNGFISCRKLTLSKPTEEDPPHFEIVKSWVMHDDVEIETVRRE